ncbi:MAG TPA: molybdate ABC transporter substrate-binding protein [Desulfotomaculum sp.]|nr:molybdate ABC transporter substrate-binding protein [Desulfotomaculum sp.]
MPNMIVFSRGERHVFAIVLTLIITMALAGCAGKNQEQTQGQAGQQSPAREGTQQETLLVYSGAGLRKAMDEIGRVFQEQTGIHVSFSYAGSAQNNNQILLSRKGDVCIPGDVTELEPLRKEKLVTWEKKVVYHIPALAVPKGNPAGIKQLADLAKPGVKVVLGDPKTNPMGKVSDAVLQKAGLLEKVNKNVVARTPTINELLVYVSMKQADAAIIGVENYPEFKDRVDIVPLPELQEVNMVVPVAVLACSAQPDRARLFAEFVASDQARAIWEKNGFKPYRE